MDALNATTGELVKDECTDSAASVDWWRNLELPRPFRGECALGFPVNEELEEVPAKLCGYCDWRS